MEKDEIVSRAAVEDDQDAKEAYQELASSGAHPFVYEDGTRGLVLNNSRFGDLADYLYYQCGWPAYAIKSRLKHYEGWDNHGW